MVNRILRHSVFLVKTDATASYSIETLKFNFLADTRLSSYKVFVCNFHEIGYESFNGWYFFNQFQLCMAETNSALCDDI